MKWPSASIVTRTTSTARQPIRSLAIGGRTPDQPGSPATYRGTFRAVPDRTAAFRLAGSRRSQLPCRRAPMPAEMAGQHRGPRPAARSPRRGQHAIHRSPATPRPGVGTGRGIQSRQQEPIRPRTTPAERADARSACSCWRQDLRRSSRRGRAGLIYPGTCRRRHRLQPAAKPGRPATTGTTRSEFR